MSHVGRYTVSLQKKETTKMKRKMTAAELSMILGVVIIFIGWVAYLNQPNITVKKEEIAIVEKPKVVEPPSQDTWDAIFSQMASPEKNVVKIKVLGVDKKPIDLYISPIAMPCTEEQFIEIKDELGKISPQFTMYNSNYIGGGYITNTINEIGYLGATSLHYLKLFGIKTLATYDKEAFLSAYGLDAPKEESVSVLNRDQWYAKCDLNDIKMYVAQQEYVLSKIEYATFMGYPSRSEDVEYFKANIREMRERIKYADRNLMEILQDKN